VRSVPRATRGYDAPVTTREPGERPPPLDRAPGDRYPTPAEEAAGPRIDPWIPVAVVLGGVVAYTVLGGILTVTAGLIVVAVFLGWLIGRLVSPPAPAAAVALGAVVLGLLGIWLFGRIEGGVLDPIAYLDEVQGWPLVAAQLIGGAGMAAAASH
jgi:hypothetical protein